ncbi:hypothetical protein [Streptomyces canus]|uniref:hypothetical protein n=1 Tax=Streptomyces canus TaxID=58343 RepID=UPI0030E1EE30
MVQSNGTIPFHVAAQQEIAQALALIDRTTQGDLEGSEFTDALAKVIEAKREEKPLPEAPKPRSPEARAAGQPEQPGKVLDLGGALN